MAISSLGVGSSILTQDVIDQLRAADDAQFINPIDRSISADKAKQDELDVVDAHMTNLIDSINEIKSNTLFDERSAEVTGTSVEVTADANTDVQDFTLNVVNLATKQIEQSGAFALNTETIATAAGSINLNIDGLDFSIAYDETTTLDDLKNAINDAATDKANATVVQISAGEFRLFVSSADTGTTQDITITDSTGNLTDTRLTTDMTAIQTGVDANFTFNGQAITRTSNNIDDLVTGLNITLKEVGLSTVSVQQNLETIMEKFDSFVEHYNATISELNKMTTPGEEEEDRGVFSKESTIKSMKSSIESMVLSIGGGVGSMIDYGFDVDKDGVMSLDKDLLTEKLNDNSTNVEAFFAGGTFTNPDASTVLLDGAFTEFSTKVESYTKYNAILDQFRDSITHNISSLEDRKESATARLEAKYEIMAKRFAAYDLMISKFNSASSMFTQMANAQTAASN
ncbi:flagellar filament capping protein FliD [Candidatus Sulfurimonas baltica]|uniref:Flagellar hook-associated protein 2 n=1 Tax=Candidatus Sulfurimonas baltica TaxID=2740404 RepID=A0A7S7RN28_9BACT|nr:flagellar filament capping protein FliD [Candidatus Sulfurimonas baltica]QOY52005.1 flagellar filament capping protein FliD [Candidatus Sulfurimonas baltica]